MQALNVAATVKGASVLAGQVLRRTVSGTLG